MQVIAAGGCGGDAHGRCPSSKPKSESKRWICCHLSCNKPLKTLIILNWRAAGCCVLLVFGPREGNTEAGLGVDKSHNYQSTVGNSQMQEVQRAEDVGRDAGVPCARWEGGGVPPSQHLPGITNPKALPSLELGGLCTDLILQARLVPSQAGADKLRSVPFPSQEVWRGQVSDVPAPDQATTTPPPPPRA